MRLLSTDLVDVALVRFPCPVADAVRALEAAGGAHERRDRLVECFRAVVRTLAAIALASRDRSQAADPELAGLLDRLGERSLTDGQWVAVLRLVCAPRGAATGAVPELAAMMRGRGRRALARACDQLLAMRRSETVAHGATGDRAEVDAVLARRAPALAALLELAAPLFTRYRIAVPAAPRSLTDRSQVAHVLSGESPARARWRRIELVGGPHPPFEPVLVDEAAAVRLRLAPFVVACLEGEQPRALAFLDGRSRRGSRYLELPSVREHVRDPSALHGLLGPAAPAARVVAARAPVLSVAAVALAAAALVLGGVTAGGDHAAPVPRAPPSAALGPPPQVDRDGEALRLLAEARAALADDPTRALELLRQVDDAGDHGGAARVLAAAAIRRGVSARVLRGHRTWIGAMAVDAAGTFAVSGGGDGSVRAWQLASGDARSLPGHDGAVLALALSADGDWIASAGADTTVRLWHRDRREGFVLSGHAGWVDRLVFSADGRHLASAGRDGVVRAWRLGRRPELAREYRGHHGPVVGAAFAAGGRWLVSAGADRTVRVWDRRSGQARVLRGHRAPLVALIAIDDAHVATADRDGGVRLWSLAAGESRELADLPAAVTAMARGGDALLVGTAGGAVWRCPHAGDAAATEVHRGETPVTDVASLPGAIGAAGHADGTVVAFDRMGARVLRGHTGPVRQVASAGAQLLSAAGDGALRLWHTGGGDRVVRGADRVAVIAPSGDGAILAASVTGELRRLDGVADRHLARAAARVVSLARASDGAIAAGTESGTVLVLGGTGRTLEAHRGPVSALGFAPGGALLVSGGDDGEVRAWDRSSGRMLWRRSIGDAVTWIGVTSTVVAVTGWDGSVHLFDRDGAGSVIGPGLGDVAGTAALSPDGSTLAVASWSGVVRVVDLVSRTHVDIDAHRGAVRALSFSGDGARLATGGADGRVRVWTMSAGGPGEPRDLVGHAGEVTTVGFCDHGAVVVSGASDGELRVWDPRSAANVVLTGHEGAVQGFVITPRGVVSLARSGELIMWRGALPRPASG